MRSDWLFLRRACRKLFFSPQARIAFFSALLFGLFSHGMGLFNKLSHQDDIANLFGFGATITSGRWMLHVFAWMEGLLFGTGNASLPLYNGLLSILCVGVSCALLVCLLRIRNPVSCALLSCLMVAFPVMTALFSYMFTSHPYMIGFLMMVLSGCLICRGTSWRIRVFAAFLGGASIGVYQAFLPVLLAILLIDDVLTLQKEEPAGVFLRRAGIQALCVAGALLVYFAASRFFLERFHLTLTSYQGIDRMGMMSVPTFLKRVGTAYRVFFFPPRNVAEDMYPGTLYYLYELMLAANVLLALFRVIRMGKTNPAGAVFTGILYALIPLGCQFIHIMSDDVHGLMVFGQAMQFALLIAQLDEWETRTDRAAGAKRGKNPLLRTKTGKGRAASGKQIVSLAASVLLAAACIMYARFDNQCYLKDTLQQQEAMSYYTTLITRIKSQEGYTPDTQICFVNDWSEFDPTIYNLPEMDFIHLNLYGRDTTEYIHIAKEFFMRAWCGFEANWYWGEEPDGWPEVQAMPEYPADGSIQMIRDVLIVKF